MSSLIHNSKLELADRSSKLYFKLLMAANASDSTTYLAIVNPLNQIVDAGVPDYPVSPYVSLLTESIGNSIKEYLSEGGKAKSVLKQMEKDYTKLAKELEYR